MNEIPKKPIFIPLAPEGALYALKNKKPEYLEIWNQIIPYYFSAQEFCDLLNEVRRKRIQYTQEIDKKIEWLKNRQEQDTTSSEEKQFLQKRIDDLKTEKKDVFIQARQGVFQNILYSRCKNANITHSEVYKLVWSLAGINKTTKELAQDQNEKTNKDVYKELSYMDTYEEEILSILEQYINEYFTEKGITNSINTEERKEYAPKAWSLFSNRHKDDIKDKKMEEIRKYLQKKGIL